MADYGRYSDDQTRDRESSRFGRGMDDNRNWDRERGDHDRHRSGMFGSGSNRGDEDRGDWRNEDRDSRRKREFGYDDRHEGLPIDETSRLIASNKVEGTAVYARDGARLGSIYNFMVDKRSG